MQTMIRNGQLDQLAELLKTQQAAKVDLVIPGGQLTFDGAEIHAPLPEPELTSSGVISSMTIQPTPEMIGDLAERAKIPVRYLRKLFEMQGGGEGWDQWRGLVDETLRVHYHDLDRREKRYLLRCFRDDDGLAIGRALLSNSYRAIDHLDVLMATLEGVKESGVEAEVTQCNLSPRSMRVRFAAPAIRAMAPELLEGYRTPWENEDGTGYGTAGLRDDDGNLPLVFAGFEISNSEIGEGSAKVTPIITVKICNNGMVINAAAKAHRHTGGKLEEGTVNWSEGTQRKSVELISSQTTDIVRHFLSAQFVQEQVEQLTEKAGTPVDSPKETIERIGQRLSWNDEEQDSILAMFIRGGQSTAGGVMHAVTAAAQVIEDPDRAWEIESMGVEAMELV